MDAAAPPLCLPKTTIAHPKHSGCWMLRAGFFYPDAGGRFPAGRADAGGVEEPAGCAARAFRTGISGGCPPGCACSAVSRPTRPQDRGSAHASRSAPCSSS